jgi:hypothetical protein
VADGFAESVEREVEHAIDAREGFGGAAAPVVGRLGV